VRGCELVVRRPGNEQYSLLAWRAFGWRFNQGVHGLRFAAAHDKRGTAKRNTSFAQKDYGFAQRFLTGYAKAFGTISGGPTRRS
jgi:hypothetical protein